MQNYVFASNYGFLSRISQDDFVTSSEEGHKMSYHISLTFNTDMEFQSKPLQLL